MLRSKKTKQSGARPEDQALKVALYFIKARPRSSFEVARRLKKANYHSKQINSVIETLTKLDILNDARFAREWVLWRDRFHLSGRFLLERELKEKGLTDELITEVLDQRDTPEWFEEVGLEYTGESLDQVLARNLLAQRLPQLAGLTLVKKKQRLISLLTSRGFSSNLVYSLVLST